MPDIVVGAGYLATNKINTVPVLWNLHWADN